MAQQKRILQKLTAPCKIGDKLEVDVLMNREMVFDTDVTEYPVENGFVVSDHVTRKPLKVSMTVVFTPTPVTWAEQIKSKERIWEAMVELNKIYLKGEPIDVRCHDIIFRQMVMTHAPFAKNIRDGVCLNCQLDFIQVRIVKPKTEEIPAANTSSDAKGMAGESEKDGGSASQEDIGSGTDSASSQGGSSEGGTSASASSGQGETGGTNANTNSGQGAPNTKAANKANAGNISTKKELTAWKAAGAITTTLVAKSWRG